MGFKCGIVGLPNVGKSTLFNALTEAEIESENYPFCTIEPNIGVVPVCRRTFRPTLKYCKSKKNNTNRNGVCRYCRIGKRGI